MEKIDKIFNQIEWKGELVVKLFFLTGIISPILSAFGIIGYYLFDDFVSKENEKTVNKVLSFWLYYISFNTFLSLSLSFILLSSVTSIESASELSTLQMSLVSNTLIYLQYALYFLILINAFRVIKTKDLIIPVPSSLALSFTKKINIFKEDKEKSFLIKEIK